MAFYQMNMSTKNKLGVMIALALALALGVGLIFNQFVEKSNFLPLKLGPIAKLDHVINNKYELSGYTHEEIDELNKDVFKIKITKNESSPPCAIYTNVLPVRLTISEDNRIKSFGSYITENYLFMALKKRSYDCEGIKLYFAVEYGASDDYLNQLIAKIDKLKVMEDYRPVILHALPLPLLF